MLRGPFSLVVFVAIAGCSDPDAQGHEPCQCAAGSRCDSSNVCRIECQDDDGCSLCDSCQDGLCRPTSPCRCDDPGDCSDGDPCNGDELCDNGVCAAASAPYECDPSVDVCFDNVCRNDQGVAVCELEPSGACPCSTDPECDDGDVCTGAETCQGGHCYPGTPHDCPPVGACRTNTCVDNAGTPTCQVVLAPLNAPCDDGVACTDATCNASGDCIGSPTVCDDSIACTTDTCNPSLDACEFTAVDAACTDGEECTDDICDPAQGDAITGCWNPNNAIGCDDGIECTENDSCRDGVCTGDESPSFVTSCGTVGFCMDGACLSESSGQYNPPSSPCLQDWSAAGIVTATEPGSGAVRFAALLNARFYAHASCTPETTYTYVRGVAAASLTNPPDLTVDLGGVVARVAATTTCVVPPDGDQAGYAFTWGDIGTDVGGPGAGKIAYDEVHFHSIGVSNDQPLMDQIAAYSVLDWPTAVGRAAPNRLFVGGRHETTSEGIYIRCTHGTFGWGCGAANEFTSIGADREPSAIHPGYDPVSDTDHPILAVQHDDGSVTIDRFGTSSAGGDSGPFSNTQIFGAVARSWDDVFFFGSDELLIECTYTSGWTCMQLPTPQLGWTIRGGAVSESGHLFLVGPYSFTIGVSTFEGNRLSVLPAGVAPDSPDNWIALPLENTGADQQVSRVAVSADAIQVLGETVSVGGGRILIWSYEP